MFSLRPPATPGRLVCWTRTKQLVDCAGEVFTPDQLPDAERVVVLIDDDGTLTLDLQPNDQLDEPPSRRAGGGGLSGPCRTGAGSSPPRSRGGAAAWPGEIRSGLGEQLVRVGGGGPPAGRGGRPRRYLAQAFIGKGEHGRLGDGRMRGEGRLHLHGVDG